jgi:hypothetical protein
MDNIQNTTENTELAMVADVNFQSLIAQSEKLQTLKPVINLSAEYIELEKVGESFRGIYIGKQRMQVTDQATGETRDIEGVRFLINKQVKINAGVVLVNEIDRSGINVGTPVEVAYTSKKGNVKIYSLTLLG